MAAIPPLGQIAGSHIGTYEAYYKQADPNGTGSIGALDAASFLKKSSLQDTVLSKVWDLSDPSGKGYLEKTGFYVALKLVALAQNNLEMGISKLTEMTPAPNLGPVETKTDTSSVTDEWAITAAEKSKYDPLYESLHPVNNLLSGDKVKPMLINSKLPIEILGKIWDLSDIDKDGFLDKDEFFVCMHLVYKAIEKEPVPQALPPKLIPPSKRKKGAPVVGGVPVLPTIAARSSPVHRADSPAMMQWVVNPVDKATYDVMFKKADLDMDGFVSGEEIRTVFLQSGVPSQTLAHIWNLCDTNGAGKLNAEQFALAMFLVQKKLKGIDPPTALTPDMVPPSMRPKSSADTTAFGVTDGVNAGPYGHVADSSAIKELDIITKEIEDMKREKLQLERDNAQTEADIKICNGEVAMSQKELDAITATLQQLETQKQQAQKRLDELDEKKSNLESNAKELRDKCKAEQDSIDDLHAQITNREQSVQNQEKELEKLRVELNALKDEESQLEQRLDGGKQQLDLLIKSQNDLQLQISQTQLRCQHLIDQERGVKHSIASYTSSLNSEVSNIFSNQLADEMSSRATYGSSPVSTVSNFSTGSALDDFKDDPFKNKDAFSGDTGSGTDPFQNEDPFKEGDPFKSTFSADPFASEDPFKPSFDSTSGKSSGKDDPFASMDPFASFGTSSDITNKMDAFDPFGKGSTESASKPSKPDSLFTSDPFAPKSPSKSGLGPKSPAPVLPPKQKKKPPPRPAPPKSRPTPSPSAQQEGFGAFDSDPFAGNDPFSSTGGAAPTNNADPFANFADFSPGKFDDNSTWG